MPKKEEGWNDQRVNRFNRIWPDIIAFVRSISENCLENYIFWRNFSGKQSCCELTKWTRVRSHVHEYTYVRAILFYLNRMQLNVVHGQKSPLVVCPYQRDRDGQPIYSQLLDIAFKTVQPTRYERQSSSPFGKQKRMGISQSMGMGMGTQTVSVHTVATRSGVA